MRVRQLLGAIARRSHAVAPHLLGRRQLLVYRWCEIDRAVNSQAHDPTIRACTPEEFRTLPWLGNTWVFREAHTFAGSGRQTAYCAFNPDGSMEGFAWLEEQAADLQFFFSSCSLPDNIGYLSRVWTDERARGRGLAKRLVGAMQHEARRRAGGGLIGACVPSNHRMQRVFESCGWQRIGRIDRLGFLGLSFFTVHHASGRVTRTRGGHDLFKHLLRTD